MKKLPLLIALLCALPSLTWAQSNAQFQTIVLGPTGRPAAGVTVTVCASPNTLIPCSPTVNIFDSTGAGITNPTLTDGKGNLNFFAPPGDYVLSFTGSQITPYNLTIRLPCVVGGTGCGGGGGGGTVGPGTPGTFAGFNGTNTIGNTDCTFDNINPDRCPNGMNTATGGYYAEWPVGPSGVVASHLVCRVNSNQAQICPAGTTQGVLGVAQATVASGGVAKVCFAGKCNVTVSNNSTAGDWLIPSASVAGDVDDTGSTVKPATGVQTLPAETSVTAGQLVLTTFLSPDTINGTSGIAGTIVACPQDGVAYYSAPGTANTLNCIPSPVLIGSYYLNWILNSNAATVPVASRAGAAGRIVSGAVDTIVVRDRDPKIIYYTSPTGAGITVPDVGSTGFDQSPVFRVIAANTTGGTQAFTFTRQAASTITVVNGTSIVTGLTSFQLTTGQSATFSTSDGANWTVVIPGGVSTGGFAWGGDGSDGVIDFNGTNTFAGIATVVGSPPTLTYTLIRDVFATQLIVEAGITVKTAQNAVFANTSIVVNGTLRNNGLVGASGTANTGGVGGISGENGLVTNGIINLSYPWPSAQSTGPGGGNGAIGGTGAGANAATPPQPSANGANSLCTTSWVPSTWASGNGGTAGATVGGNGGNDGTSGTVTPRADLPRLASRAVPMIDSAGAQYTVCNNGPSARGGGAGAGDGVNNGGHGGGAGGGGGNGGFLVASSPLITIGAAGIISANGGTGGAGSNGNNAGNGGTAGNAAGGGGGAGGVGGNGGAVALVFHLLVNNGTLSAAAGSGGSGGGGGAGGGTGTNGTAGSSGPTGLPGFIFQIQN